MLGNEPKFGRIRIQRWDTVVFGFAVADYETGDPKLDAASRERLSRLLRDWAAENSVELIGCSIPGEARAWRALLPGIGFDYVDTTLHATLARLQAMTYRPLRMPVRLALPDDRTGLEAIGERAFRAGRYHADPRFPRELADLRYRRWLADAVAAAGPANRIYVTGESGAPTAFVHVTLQDSESGYVTLMGADPSAQSSTAPVAVWIGTMQALKDAGIRRLDSKLSAGNPRMINLAAYAGWRLSEPRFVFHWHAPEARHLLRFE